MLLWIQLPRVGKHGGGATCVDVVDHSVKWLGRRGAGPQQGREFLEQLLYLGQECSDGGGGLGAPGVIKKIVTCLSEGAARGRVQNLPLSWENRELKFCKKIHSNYGSNYCCKKKNQIQNLGCGK